MRFLSQYYQEIEGIEIYPIIVLLLFMTSFFLMLYVILRTDKKQTDMYSRIPLDDNNSEFEQNNF